jgi:hypothetical protein
MCLVNVLKAAEENLVDVEFDFTWSLQQKAFQSESRGKGLFYFLGK